MNKSRIGLNPCLTTDESIALLIGLGDKRLSPTADFRFEGSFCLNEYLYEEFDGLESACKFYEHEEEPEEILIERFESHKKLIKTANELLRIFTHELSQGDSSTIKKYTQKILVNSNAEHYTIISIQKWAEKCLGLPSMSPDDFLQGNFKLPELSALNFDFSKQTEKPKRELKSNKQDDAILSAIKELGLEPKELQRNEKGKAGVKSKTRKMLKADPLFKNDKVFDHAWKRVFDLDVLAYKEESPTHK